MTQVLDETLMRAAFAPARTLEPTDAEVAAVLGRAQAAGAKLPRRSPGRGRAFARRLAPSAAAVLLLLGSGYAAAEPVRTAIDGAAGTFADWLGGDSHDAPGRALDASDAAPDYFRDPRYVREPRVIAEAGGYKLFVARNADGGVTFDLGDTGIALGGPSASMFGDHAVIVLGPGAMANMDPGGHVPLFGVTARTVARVELTYASGPPLRVGGVKGGFVLLAEPDRSPKAVVAYDAAGNEAGRQLVDDSDHSGPRIDWRQYGPPAPVIPTRCQPGVAGPNPPADCPNA